MLCIKSMATQSGWQTLTGLFRAESSPLLMLLCTTLSQGEFLRMKPRKYPQVRDGLMLTQVSVFLFGLAAACRCSQMTLHHRKRQNTMQTEDSCRSFYSTIIPLAHWLQNKQDATLIGCLTPEWLFIGCWSHEGRSHFAVHLGQSREGEKRLVARIPIISL